MLYAGNLIKHPCFNEMRQNGTGYRVVGLLENTDRIMQDTFWIGAFIREWRCWIIWLRWIKEVEKK